MPVHTSEWHSGRAGKVSGNTPSPEYPLGGYLNREGCHRLQIRSHRLVVQADRIELDFVDAVDFAILKNLQNGKKKIINFINGGDN